MQVGWLLILAERQDEVVNSLAVLQPTFNPDSARLTRDIVLVSRISRFNNGFRRGDIVTFW